MTLVIICFRTCTTGSTVKKETRVETLFSVLRNDQECIRKKENANAHVNQQECINKDKSDLSGALNKCAPKNGEETSGTISIV